MIGSALSVLATLGAPQSGCGTAHAAGAMRIAVSIPGSSRDVLVHLPRGYDGAQQLPLVLNLHGSGSRGSEQLASSKLAATADAHGFIVAAPDAGIAHDRGFVWNIPGVPTVSGSIPGPGAPDDVAFVRALIDTLDAQLCVDTRRVYATGLSGGGRMASWLGCAAADRIAAIAPVVGLRAGRALGEDQTRVDTASCTPARAVPVLSFAGAQDRTNPIAGGEGARWGYSMHAAEQRWAAINGCRDAPFVRWIEAGTYAEGYTGCRDGADVTAHVDVAGEHNWLVADNEAMWAFFARHSLPD
ncbi:alpha/beta hydrolase family esterase [Sphingomonas japonica]|uniref:Polyhydroxybutyrate depolymerase n=1 Tax=Sphingomonas japonica TaxID=511662 RepID=A0ABX0TZW0_9SPHN|nr:PHB depolymerase family esterase [Sphingomonas japonica]NIJ23850.1 polyhydroxybutyrate depolymerase [Sphingomonas japonica]